MIDLQNLPTHPLVEQIVDHLVISTDAECREYFRVLVGYYFSKVAGSMRAEILTPEQPEAIPVNCFAITLADSGFGKGKSVGIMEREIVSGFKRRFMDDTFPVIADQALWKMAITKAAMSGKTEDEEKTRLDKMFMTAGSYQFTSKSATASSIQQKRGKLLMATIGAHNLQVDEIAKNITKMGVDEALTTFLELYDMGRMEVAETKNSNDNIRIDDIDGCTPANLLVFGEPEELFDGSSVESAFMSFLKTGYSRRCLFSWGEKPEVPEENLTTEDRAKQRLKMRIAARQASNNNQIKNHFALLADPAKHGWIMTVPDDVALRKTAYEIICGDRAKEFTRQDKVRRAEMLNRHWKALKLAGALAFVDESSEITTDHLLAAIGIVEGSGEAFHKMLNRERNYMRLARFMAEYNGELTHADLQQELPFYPSSPSAQKDLLHNARSWGYKNHHSIRARFDDGIEVFTGETLEQTDLDKMILSYSQDMAYDYEPALAPFERLHELTQADGLHWANHHFENKHRSDEHTLQGFNMVVFDFDGGVRLELVHELLDGYRYMTSTTKRHTEDEHRFRLILPINYLLRLDKEDYRTFVEGLSDWLPIQAKADEASMQRSKKWLTNPNGTYHYGEGDVVNCLPFIPRTTKNEDYQKEMQELGSLDNLERWFAQRMVANQNRNNMMIKYALALVDSGMSYNAIEAAVLSFNSRLSDPLDVSELQNSVLVTAAKKVAEAA